jgi:hypothetical protein
MPNVSVLTAIGAGRGRYEMGAQLVILEREKKRIFGGLVLTP